MTAKREECECDPAYNTADCTVCLERQIKPFCHACQAIPTHGYCNMTGCPMPTPVENTSQPGMSEANAPIPWATCQACGGAIEGWICQSCDREFHENDKGDLVMDEGHAPIPAVQSGAVAWTNEENLAAISRGFGAATMWPNQHGVHSIPLYLAAPQSEPLPEEDREELRYAISVVLNAAWGEGLNGLQMDEEEHIDAILAALSGKEQG